MATLDYNGIMAKIKRDEKSSLYLLHGEDQYLLHEVERRILLQLLHNNSDIDSDNDAVVHLEKNASVGEIEQALLQTNFFTDRNVVVIRNSHFWGGGISKNKDNTDISKLLCDMPQNSCLIFVNDGKTDKRLNAFKLLEKQGIVVEINKLKNMRDITNWLGQKLRDTKIKMDVYAREYFIEVFSIQESSVGLLEQEWEKLALYTMDKKVIKAEDLQAIDIGQTGALIFKVSDAIWKKDVAQTLHLLEKYFLHNGSLQAFTALIAKQMLQMLVFKEQMSSDTWSVLGLNYAQKRQVECSALFAEDDLREGVCFLSVMDTKSKNGVLTQAQGRIALENFILKLLCAGDA